MALVKNRRQLNLRLPGVESSERRPRFPLPLPPPALSTTISLVDTSLTAADVEKLEVLGHGNGGRVYKVRHKKTSAIYALKVVHSDSDPKSRRQILREISILRQTDSKYVVKCEGVFEKTGGDIAILMEYMDKGTLESLMKSGVDFSEDVIAKIAYQVVQGLEHLHSRKIIHRDLKPSNLLVDTQMQVKIADFGVSKIMCRTLDPCNSYVGTCAYMSPERFDPDTYGKDGSYNGYSSDIWSLGLTLLELFMGHFPYLPAGQRPDWATLMCSICFGEPPSLPDTVSKEFRNFIDCCLQKDSAKRWTASQLLSHPFLQKVRT